MALRYSSQNLHVQAHEAEQAGERDTAAKIYQRAIRVDPMDDHAYNRLMVYYRRKKEYRKELQIIQTAIGAHLKHAHEEQMDWL
ncbi:MAG: hypothetical protein J7578_08265, partial [Chitinophagaceae bacterium]|nr:hypothetical protein [Chitinophagaceae bacterium]